MLAANMQILETPVYISLVLGHGSLKQQILRLMQMVTCSEA